MVCKDLQGNDEDIGEEAVKVLSIGDASSGKKIIAKRREKKKKLLKDTFGISRVPLFFLL